MAFNPHDLLFDAKLYVEAYIHFGDTVPYDFRAWLFGSDNDAAQVVDPCWFVEMT